MPRKEAVVVIDGNLIFGRTREGEFAARGEKRLNLKNFGGEMRLRTPPGYSKGLVTEIWQKSVGREENCKLNLSILTSFKESF